VRQAHGLYSYVYVGKANYVTAVNRSRQDGQSSRNIHKNRRKFYQKKLPVNSEGLELAAALGTGEG